MMDAATMEKTKTGPPQRPPKPNLTRRPTEESPLNPFKEPSYGPPGGRPPMGPGGGRAADPLTGGYAHHRGSGPPVEEMQMRNRDEYSNNAQNYNRYED